MDNVKCVCTRVLAGIVSLMILWLGYCNFIIIPETYIAIPSDGRHNVRNTISKIETRYNENFYQKNLFVNINGLAHKAMGQRFMNGVYRKDSGHLYRGADLFFSKEHIETVTTLRDRLAEEGIPFLAITMVRALSCNDTVENVPILENAGNFDQSINEFSNKLAGNQISVLNLTEAVDQDGLVRDDLFYKTDHHCTTMGTFWIYTKVLERLEEEGFSSVDTQYRDLAQFNIDVYPNYFMGSIGRRVGDWYCGLDDYVVLTPKFETECVFEVPGRDILREGSFEEAVLSKAAFQKTDDLFSFYPYNTYIGADYGLAIIQNKNAPIDKTVAITKDSFMRPVCAFLSLTFTEVHIIDPRRFHKEMSLTIIDYLIDLHPDLVISEFSSPEEIRFDFGV